MQGLILINKPKNISSFGVVHRIKKLTGEKRVGHTGTLDPMATGVLPVFVGRATVLSSYLLEADKSYLACIKLGTTTDTYDITGKITSENEVKVTNRDLDEILTTFIGEQNQIPPMFSALKKEGKKLYELARQGYEVERSPRRIRIHNIKRITDIDNENCFRINVVCSKGTYIRSLCNDIGNRLGCGAVLTELCRDSANGINIMNCVPLEKLTEENIAEYIIPEEYAVARFDPIGVTEKQAIRFSNGGELDVNRLHIDPPYQGQLFRVKYNSILLGVGRYESEKNAIVIDCIVNQYKGE